VSQVKDAVSTRLALSTALRLGAWATHCKRALAAAAASAGVTPDTPIEASRKVFDVNYFGEWPRARGQWQQRAG
jgi:hypothetical protein